MTPAKTALNQTYQMTSKPRDPLLLAARIILIFMMAIMGIVVVACALLAVASLVAHGKLVAELALHTIPEGGAWAITPLLTLIAGGGGLGFLFFRHLYRIVGTVGDGDPFTLENAKRLSAMGWIVVAVYALSLPLLGTSGSIASAAKESRNIDCNISLDFNGSFDFGGILLALILFILARVFREGARMREELEETI